MKTTLKLIIALIVFFSAGICRGQESDHAPLPRKVGSLDYWMAKMRDTKTNYINFEQEFNRYWAGKTPVKGSGYKQVARWLDHQRAYVNPDGTIRSPQEDLDNARANNKLYLAQAITGDWTSVGPDQPVYRADAPTTIAASQGRVTAIAFHPTNNSTIYVGAPLGGLWVSQNNGVSWQSLNTDQIAALGVSAIAIKPNDPDVIYIGTGDRDSHVTRGIGIYKSADGGLTWTSKALDSHNDHYVSKIIINPNYPDSILVASSWGIFQSGNGGQSWVNRHHFYITDMEMKPNNYKVVYCVSENTCYRSTDFGTTWTSRLTTDASRMAISVTANAPEKVILLSTKDSHFYKIFESNNSGDYFGILTVYGIPEESQGGYNLDIVIDPQNKDIMYAGMVNFYKSTDGGHNWVNQEDVYADDQHTFEIHPVTHRVFIGNDSGIWYTDNGTNYVYSSTGLRICSSYRMDVAANNPNHIIIGNQDAATFVTNGGNWYSSIGGDGITCKFDPTNQNYVYGSSQIGYVARSVNGGVAYANFSGVAANGSHGIDQEALFQTPFMIDYFDPNKMFYGAHDVFRSINIKQSNPASVTFTKISNNIVGSDLSQKIEFIEQSRANENILYVAYANGRLFRTDNALAASPSWVELPSPNNYGGVRFESHATDENIVYMVRGKDVYKSVNKGESWTNIRGTLPQLGMMSIAYMNGSKEGLYVGTTAGVYYKDSTMTSWQLFKSNLPLTQVRDLVINYSTTPAQLFASTFGRGIWKTTVLPSYVPDLLAGSGSATINSTLVSALCGFQNTNTMVSIPSLKCGFYLSTNNLIAGVDYLVGQNTHSNIGPGLIYQSQMAVTDVALVQPEIPVGTYFLGMLVDNIYAIDETNENNNTWLSPTLVIIPANPAAPINVQATDGAYDNKTTITWQNGTTETLYYAVFRKPFYSLVYTQISPTTWLSGTSFDDVTGDNGETYYYYIKSSRYPTGKRSSDYSSSDAGFMKIAPPANVQASDGQFGDRVSITWNPSSGATHYQVWRSADPYIINISGPIWLSSTSFDDMTASMTTVYTYYVKAAKSVFGGYESNLSTGNSGWVGFVTAPDVTATDGLYTDRVELSWNTVTGATFYRLYRNTRNNPETATTVSTWQAATTFSDNTASAGTIYYYWVKASMDASFTVTTGLGGMDTGFRNLTPPANVNATDGTITTQIYITWSSVTGASWYQVYRNSSSTFSSAIPISSWQSFLTFKDKTGVPGFLYYYWVKAAGDTLVSISEVSAFNSGYRRISAPVVDASTGIYPNKVAVTWQSATGATYYQVKRSTIQNPSIQTVIANWSHTLNFQFEDLTTVQGQYYNYYVTGATSSSGTRAGDAGQAVGFADACGNLVDDPAYRNINFHGTTLELSQRVVNEGPFALTNPGKIALVLENASPDSIPEAIIGYIDIPPLASGAFYDVNYVVDLDTITGFDFTYGTWHIACYTSWDNNNCDNNTDDDYIIWQNPTIQYTDAMYGIYTIAKTNGDFLNPGAALDALQTRGISDNVFFYLEPGIYYGNLDFSSIAGADSNSRIVFQTNPAATDTAEIRAIPSATENFTLRFENCDYISFINLKLSTTGASDFLSTYGRVIAIGPGCNNLKFVSNRIEGYSDASHVSDDNAVIYSNNASSGNVLIEGNDILNGAIGISMTGSNLNSGTINDLHILKNNISGFIMTGINLEFLDHPRITQNTIIQLNGQSFYLVGISFSSVKNGFDISGNKINLGSLDNGIKGILFYDINMDGLQPGLVSNNFISIAMGSSYAYGLYGHKFNNTSLLYNSINVYGTPGVFSICTLLDCEATPLTYTNVFKNNILYNQQGGYCIGYNENAFDNNLLDECDYNNMKTAGLNFALLNGVNYGDLAGWSNETGFDQHSFSIDPGFFSPTDLHINNVTLDGAGAAQSNVLYDIDEELRSATNPDIGADEYTIVLPAKTLRCSVYLEGLYAGSGLMSQANDEDGPHWPIYVADHITVELHNSTNYSTVEYTTEAALSTTGLVTVSIPGNKTGSYYVTIKHRNSIETTSNLPVNFSGSSISFKFNAQNKAYGNNMGLMIDGAVVIYAGDANQDGLVDGSDLSAIANLATIAASGYIPEDLNGDGLVDGSDLALAGNNADAAIGTITP